MSGDIHKLFLHLAWADARLLGAVRAAPTPPAGVLEEYGHVLGADEVWLARLLGRSPRIAVWPSLTLAELAEVAAAVHEGYRLYLATLDDRTLDRTVAYTNSAGHAFESTARDILLHVALHAQYHRGKINLLLRQAGLEPSPTDLIAFLRGAPAATTRVTPPPPGAG
ncbi:MAG: DinB family protein [Gemmatimonadales bacterium]